MKLNITGYKKLCFGFLCLFSFTASSYVAFPNYFVDTGSGAGSGKQFMIMDVGGDTKKLSYDSVSASMAYAFGSGSFDVGVSASYALSHVYQISLISRYHFFSGGIFDIGTTITAGFLGAGLRLVPVLSNFLVASSRWGVYEVAFNIGVAPTLGKRTHTFFSGRKFSRGWSYTQVGTCHTYHWTSDCSTTLAFHTNLKARYFAFNLQARCRF